MRFSLFKPLAIKNASSLTGSIQEIQEALQYAESRFSTILLFLNKIINQNNVNQYVWIHKLLQRELVGFSFSFLIEFFPNFINLFLGIHTLCYRHGIGIRCHHKYTYHHPVTCRQHVCRQLISCTRRPYNRV